MSFKDLIEQPGILKAIEDLGYTTPTPIQKQAIPLILSGCDLRGSAQTGTGKTAAFILPALCKLAKPSTLHGRGPRVLILVPTRELAIQVAEEASKYCKYLDRIKTVCIYGGAPYPIQNRQLARPYEILVATPGRLMDHMNRGKINFSRVEMFILDEADRMLDMGFIRDIRAIMAHLRDERQTLFLSATITPDIQQLISTILKDPVTVSVRRGETSDHVEQDVVRVEGGKPAKEEKLVELLGDPEFSKVLIFGETKWGVQRLADRLAHRGFKVAAIHGNKSQPQRQKALNDFKAERIQALIATDVAARGLDIPNVSHVINYDPPKQYEDYVHRIGRTGRAGAMGKALTFVADGPEAFAAGSGADRGGRRR